MPKERKQNPSPASAIPNGGIGSSKSFPEIPPAELLSFQGDIRIDQNISPKQNIFGRFNYKAREVVTAPTTGSVLQGPYSKPDTTFGVTIAYNC